MGKKKRRDAPDLTSKVTNAIWAGSRGGNISGSLSHSDCVLLANIALEAISEELEVKNK